MTAAHRLPGVLMRRCRGARAVANFNAAEAGSSPAVERIVTAQFPQIVAQLGLGKRK